MLYICVDENKSGDSGTVVWRANHKKLLVGGNSPQNNHASDGETKFHVGELAVGVNGGVGLGHTTQTIKRAKACIGTGVDDESYALANILLTKIW